VFIADLITTVCDRLAQPRSGWAVVTTTIPLRFDYHSTAISPRYDHSTTYVTTAGLPVVGCCTAS